MLPYNFLHKNLSGVRTEKIQLMNKSFKAILFFHAHIYFLSDSIPTIKVK